MYIEQLDPPPFEYGRIPKFGDTHKLNLPAKKYYHHVARRAKPFLDYFINQSGFTTISLNPGQGNRTEIPVQYRNTILFHGTIRAIGGGKPWSQFTEPEARSVADYHWGVSGGYAVLTSNLAEHDGINDPWVEDYPANPAAYKALEKRFSELCEQNGGANFGGYDGVFVPQFGPNDADAKAAFMSDQGSLNYLSSHEVATHPYWSIKAYEYQHCLVKHYFNGYTDMVLRFVHMAGANELISNAMRLVAPDKRRMGFCFKGKTEFVGYTERQEREIGDGDKYFDHTFPNYCPSHQIDQTFFILDQLTDFYGWEDGTMYGDNPAIVPPNYTRFDGFYLRGQINSQGQAIQKLATANPDVVFNPGQSYPFPGTVEGINDLEPAGALLYQQCCEWIGGPVEATWVRHRGAGRDWCSDGRGYLPDRLSDRLPCVRMGRKGSRAWVKIVANDGDFGDSRTMDVDLGGGVFVTLPYDILANNTYLIDING
jgi:hypothetical protein